MSEMPDAAPAAAAPTAPAAGPDKAVRTGNSVALPTDIKPPLD